ncbi:MAG: lipid A biosynthesis acyltransferase [Paucibacter sp.]|nr:lipid A biosynthesis acyltransferase [Roseateles sp.]
MTSTQRFQHGGARALLALLWLLHWLPLPLLAALGQGLGALLFRLARSRRRVALRNLELCFPEKSAAEREAIAREHFGWLARSLLERGVLSYSSRARLRRLTRFKGDVKLAERGGQPVMWLTPHFVGLEWVGPLLMTEQTCPGISIYQRQSNPVFDTALRRMRSRFGTTELISRHDGVRQVVRRVRQGWLFMNLPDMDFGRRDSEFVPFFGVPACTLLAPSRMAASLKMQVQPIIVTMLPGGQGYEIEACEPLADYPSEDAVADATRFHVWLEARIRANPAQYLWVHKRFKTRPEGEPALYGRR